MSGTFSLGQTLQLTVSDTLNGVATDPTALALAITWPYGGITTYSGDTLPPIVRTGVGQYSLNFLPTEVGAYSYVWTASGVATATGSDGFTIVASTFGSVVGPREAIKQQLLQMMVNALPDFNRSLSSISPVLNVSYQGMVITGAGPGQFYNGDFESIPDPATNWMWVTVESGGKADATDMEIVQLASGGDHKRTYWTEIHFYLQPEIFPPLVSSSTAPQDQTTQRNIVRDRFTDWLLQDVFTTYAAQRILLSSTTFTADGDRLNECLITRVTANTTYKGPNSSVAVYSLHALHRGVIIAPC